METETLDQLYLEIGQFTKARSKKELVLEKELRNWQQYASYCRSCALSGEHDLLDYEAFVDRMNLINPTIDKADLNIFDPIVSMFSLLDTKLPKDWYYVTQFKIMLHGEKNRYIDKQETNGKSVEEIAECIRLIIKAIKDYTGV